MSPWWPICLRKGQPSPSPPVITTLPPPQMGGNSATPRSHMQIDRMVGRQLEEPFKTQGEAPTPVVHVFTCPIHFPQPAVQGCGESTRNKVNISIWSTNMLCDPGDITEPCFALAVSMQ